jgi:hypothetical protein
MTGFPLESLGPTAFQEVAEALLIQACGIQVTPMGVGRDGGRDAKTNDSVRLTDDENVLELNGFTVFQVKHHAVLGSPSEDAAWLWGEIRKELKLWTTSAERVTMPNTLVFITNVALTPFPGSGGRDMIEGRIKAYRDNVARLLAAATADERPDRKESNRRLAQIKSIRVLDRRWVNGALAGSDSVRRAFPEMLTAADVFAGIAEYTGGSIAVSSITDALLEHARQALTIDGAVWMAEGGDSSGARVGLHDLVVDLPVIRGGEEGRTRDSILRFVVTRAERMLRPKFKADGRTRHVVVTGAAGNGKTTTAKFLVQVFRAAMLRGAALSQGQHEIVDGTARALFDMGHTLPAHLRWPIRVDLKEMLQQDQLLDGATMLSAIAARVSAELDGGRLTAVNLETWRREWPWLVVFDGFDEITDPNSRRTVIERVEQFVEEAEVANSDLMVVLTTRSLGYNDEMSSELFERVDLDYLETSEALAYADRVVRSTLAGDTNRQREVLEKIEAASQNETQRGLLRTPLQILILTIIVNGAQHLEPDRYGLFSRFFDIAFEREKSKGRTLQTVLTNFEPVIRALHRRVGYTLHVQAESGMTPDPVLTDQEMRDLIWQELDAQGYKPAAVNDRRVQQVLETATNRLVLIAPVGDGYGFEIRSLQELTAGQWLMEDHPDTATKRIRTAAASPHWRNVVLFAAGYAFHGGNTALHKDVLASLASLDEGQSSRLGSVFPVGPRLALEMVDDGMVRNRPGFRSELYGIGLKALRVPADVDFASLATMLIRIADEDVEERNALAEALRDAMTDTPLSRRNAKRVRSVIGSKDRSTFTPARQVVVAVVDKPVGQMLQPMESAWASFVAKTKAHGSADAELMKKTVKVLAASVRPGERIETDGRGARDRRRKIAERSVLLDALSDPEIARTLDSALAELSKIDDRVADSLRHDVWPEIARRPVGNDLQGT